MVPLLSRHFSCDETNGYDYSINNVLRTGEPHIAVAHFFRSQRSTPHLRTALSSLLSVLTKHSLLTAAFFQQKDLHCISGSHAQSALPIPVIDVTRPLLHPLTPPLRDARPYVAARASAAYHYYYSNERIKCTQSRPLLRHVPLKRSTNTVAF